MKLFDKMFNYELQSELAKDGDCREAFPVTATEMIWLKQALLSQSAAAFLQPTTLAKLTGILEAYQSDDMPEIFEKAAVNSPEKVPPPSFQVLRQALKEKSGLLLSLLSHGTRPTLPAPGWPILLEFNMARREWYLVWLRISDRKIRFTPLRHIPVAKLLELPDSQSIASEAAAALESHRLKAVVELNPAYPADRHRVLSALSAFDRDVEMGPGGVYRISIRYFQNEEEYLLQRIRFLGLRVKLIAPRKLLGRMRDTIARVAEIYEKKDSE